MLVALLIAVDNETIAGLRPCLPDVALLAVESANEAMFHIRSHAQEIDAVVIGSSVSAPVGVAQRVHATETDRSVLVLDRDGDPSDDLRRALHFVPQLGDSVRYVTAETSDTLAAELRSALERTRGRRAHRRTLRALNEQLAQSPPQPWLSRAEEYLEQLLDHAPIGIVVLNGDDRIVAWNPHAELLTGQTERRMLGAPLTSILLDDEVTRWDAYRHDPPPSSSPRGATFQLRGRSGPLFVETTLAAIGRRDGHLGTLVLMQDVTAREQARQDREAALAELARLYVTAETARSQAEQASRLKDEFLAVVSHELRTPLTSILGWAHILSSCPSTADELTRRLAAITRNAGALARLIEDLLDTSRLAAGQVALILAPVDLASVARHAIDIVAGAASTKGITVELDAPAPVIVVGDADRLQQVLWNLVGNAVKFTPPGGSVVVRVRGSPLGAAIVVRDTGMGISAQILPFIFDAFRQADTSTTRQHGGLGLGLAIVRQLVELHHGTVRAESEGPGAGATFTVTLPLAERAEG